jgi:predicted O-methyltransferase YrrM
MEAVKDFADGSLDFVYIDADHRFKYIAEDIYEWPWRVRAGGVVSGHDYVGHVKPVVDAYTTAFGVENLVVLNEKFPSWLWIKKTNGAR